MFSKNSQEIVSTHGYSLNQIILWKFPTMQKIQTLTGHSYRVLYLGMSPDGENIVTGAGDETLRFWNMFPNFGQNKMSRKSQLIPSSMDIR
jgi:cell division cycle 20-like protein 1 (cofactor of APC complex)